MSDKPIKAPKGPIIPDNYICLPSGPISYNYNKDGKNRFVLK
jgi:hypothetical protein